MNDGRPVLLIHDVTNGFAGEDDPALSAALANIRILVAAARKVALPVVFVAPGPGDPGIGPPPPEQGVIWGSDGSEVSATIGMLPSDTLIRKPRWGAFFGTRLEKYLHENGRDTLIICGLSTAGGVDTTVRDAYNRDLRSIVVADACRCRAVEDQGWGAFSSEVVANVTLGVLQRFARVVVTRDICGEFENWV